jgi:hypothetical protein
MRTCMVPFLFDHPWDPAVCDSASKAQLRAKRPDHQMSCMCTTTAGVHVLQSQAAFGCYVFLHSSALNRELAHGPATISGSPRHWRQTCLQAGFLAPSAPSTTFMFLAKRSRMGSTSQSHSSSNHPLQVIMPSTHIQQKTVTNYLSARRLSILRRYHLQAATRWTGLRTCCRWPAQAQRNCQK